MFLARKVEAVDPPKRLIFAGRSGEDGSRRRHQIRCSQRSDRASPSASISIYRWRTDAMHSLVRFRLPARSGLAAT